MGTSNADVAASLNKLADLLEIEGNNPFRIRAYRNAALLLKGLRVQIADMMAANQPLTDLPGIGPALALKISEIVLTGHLGALEREEKHVPPDLRNLLSVPGLGPKRVHVLYEHLNIQSLAHLEAALDSGRLRQVPGFGEKMENAIRGYLRTRTAATPLSTSDSLLEPLLDAVHPPNKPLA